jgi:hypothetical protein
MFGNNDPILGEIIMWISRYWIGGMITLMFLDAVNWITVMANTGNERYENSHRIMIFLLWPIMLLVFIMSWIKQKLNK